MYEIFTDTAANLDCSLLEELGVGLIPFPFIITVRSTV